MVFALLAGCSGSSAPASPATPPRYKVEWEKAGFLGGVLIVIDTRTGREFIGFHSGSSSIPLTEVPR